MKIKNKTTQGRKLKREAQNKTYNRVLQKIKGVLK